MIRHPGGPALMQASPPTSRFAREIVPRKSRRSSRIDPSTGEPVRRGTRCEAAAALMIYQANCVMLKTRPACESHGTVAPWTFSAGRLVMPRCSALANWMPPPRCKASFPNLILLGSRAMPG